MAELNLPQALTVCDKEPIHIPGFVQQHGVLIVVDEKDFSIVQVSNNTLEHLGQTVEEILSKNLKDLLGTQLDLIVAEIRNSTNYNCNPFACTLKVGEEHHAFDLAVHRSDNLLLFEFERSFKRDELYINHLFYQRAREVITAIPHQDDSKKLLEEVAKEVRRITKFDRVLIYKFHEDEHGEVVAESKEENIETLLGLHYPASDIPKQARSLYVKNLFRIIPDVYYTPVSLVPAINPLTNRPLDLTHSFLRSVSPIHVQYMKNMGLKASMSISIADGDRLWGLISCHNFSKRYLPYELRMACNFIGQILSWHLATVLANERSRELMERRNIMNQLISSMANNENWLEGLSKEETLLCSVMNSSGVSIHLFGLYFKYGVTLPNVASLHKFFEEKMAASKTHLMLTDHLASMCPVAQEQPDVCSGVLSCLIPGDPTGSMIWYRPQVIHTVQWAGKPAKVQEGEMLTPRKSFAIWEEDEKNKCVAWSEIDKIVAEEFRILTLETLVKHETHRLRVAEAHNRRRDEFVDTICHEIRNPINGIIGSINIIKEKLMRMKRKLEEDGVPSSELLEVDSHLDDIMDCAVHQNIVTEDALDLSKLDYGKLKLDKSPINLEKLVMTVIRMLKNSATQKEIELKTEKLSNSTFLKGDSQRIKQILINLITNAIKFTEAGSVTVSFGEESRDDNNVHVVVSVKDTGIGITDQELKCLFTKFSQPNEEVSKKLGGSGLGLFICKKLANLMGGDITVTSTPNAGSIFTLKLSSPILTSKEIEQLQGPPTKKTKTSAESSPEVRRYASYVLVVEDNIINQRILASILRKLSFSVILAKNGIEAVQQYMLHNAELSGIFMDIEMPGMNGYEATIAIRTKEKELKLPAVPIVGVSGNARGQWKSKAIETGMNDFITKPFSKDNIVQKVDQFFRKPQPKPAT